jgi:hypothetical protein
MCTFALALQVAARQVVDFDSLAFKQGGHLKSNKTTGLPEGSFRCVCVCVSTGQV